MFTEPESGTINFSGDNIILNFDDFVNRGSFKKALRVEPSFGLEYELDWGRSSVAIEFSGELPDSTTFIINLSTDFSDLNGNSLDAPKKIAVSTGPTINKGKITGKVLDARTGETRKGERVLLYRKPVNLERSANYIAETDTAGMVHFSYLRPGDYLAFWVDDRNRNGIWNKQSERAQPFSKNIISLGKEESDTLGVLFIAKSDTAHPKLQGVGLFSKRRLRLRFNENIIVTDSTKFTVTDTTGAFYSKVNPLYLVPDQPYVLFAHSSKALKDDQAYELAVQNVADEAGNVLQKAVQDFTGSSQADTTAQRIIYAGKEKGIYSDEGLKVIYAKAISDPAIQDSVAVVTADTAFTSWKKLRVQQNKLWVLPAGEWEKNTDYEIRIWQPLKQEYLKIKPNIWFKSSLGSLNVIFGDSTSNKVASRPSHLQLKTKKGQLVADTSFTASTTIKNLAPLTYQLIVYQDLNKNGEWDSGQVRPYVAPEPYFIRNEIPVEVGFTAEFTVQFKNVISTEKDSSKISYPALLDSLLHFKLPQRHK